MAEKKEFRLTEKGMSMLNYIREHGNEINTKEAAEDLGVKLIQITGMTNPMTKNGLAYREKREVPGEEKEIMFCVLTDAGINYTQD